MVYRDDGEIEEVAPAPTAPAPMAPGGAPGPAVQTAAGGGGGGGGRNRPGGPPERPTFNFAGLPGFVAPNFAAPTMEQAMAEPGYATRLGAGQNALERSAAARGLLRSGGTLQDLVEYGQKFGQQEYGNVFNRALQQFDRRYQGAKDAYAPQLARWQTLANAETQAGLAAFNARHRGGGGGGGGGGGLPPLDVILGPPPTMPDYAQMATYGGGQSSAPVSGVFAQGPGMDDERDEIAQY